MLSSPLARLLSLADLSLYKAVLKDGSASTGDGWSQILCIGHVAEDYFKPKMDLETLLLAILVSEAQYHQGAEATVRIAEYRLLPMERLNNFRGSRASCNQFSAPSPLFWSRTAFLVVRNNHI